MKTQISVEYLVMASLVIVFATIAATVVIDTRNISYSLEEKIIEIRNRAYSFIFSGNST